MTGRGVTRRRFLGIVGVAAGGLGMARLLADRPDPTGSTTPPPGPPAASTSTSMPATTTTQPTSTTSPTTTGPEDGRAVREVICREAWGADPPGDGAVGHVPDRLSLHHTAVTLESAADAPTRAREHQAYHLSQGWPDLAYHFLVDSAGNVYRGRPVEYRGDTSTDYDPTGHLLVCCEGNYEVQLPTAALLEAVADVFAWGAATFGIRSDTLAGHRDLAATACPGDNLQARIADLRTMIDDRLAGGGVVLESLCGLEGAAAVAAIRSGA
jgi:hypothetical protein